ncbi:MAG: hypothetical protein COV48_09640 [Elusimicrobia bacterium CG11_big_fil_rev_8_21_14_0_20_64_6]|nr:MAG: hypothetical protein COV48_09640 [Elusimicrobia bacterium CG11_big_fil_rev_8_21_14_0_20_64_6]
MAYQPRGSSLLLVQRRHRPTKKQPNFSGENGYTLVEVMVAMLLTSIMVTSVFSVALTVKTGGSKGERKMKAATGARLVASQLKNFVTGDPSSTVMAGPGTGTNKWSMTGGGVTDACLCTSCSANCYALMPGSHTLSGVLPATFEAAPYNAKVVYFVTVTDTISDGVNPARPIPSVSITTTWDEP